MSTEVSSKVVEGQETTQVSMDSPEMKGKIEALAEALKAVDNAYFMIGKTCNEIIDLIGIHYGEDTFGMIANLPEIQCKPRHLRRCWKYYRLVEHKDCQSPELDELIRTKPSGVQELARIMDTDMTDEEKAGLVKAVAADAISKDLTVPQIADRVTKELEWRDKMLRKPPEKKKKQANHEPNFEPNGTIVDGEMLKQYAECIRSYGKFCKIESIKDQLAVKTVVVAVMDIVGKQAEQLKGDEEYAHFLSKLISQLEQVLRSVRGKDGSKIITQIKVDEVEQEAETGSNQDEIYNVPEEITQMEVDDVEQELVEA